MFYGYAMFSILCIKSLNQMIQPTAAACTAMITEPNRLRTGLPGNSVTDAIGEGQSPTGGWLVEARRRLTPSMRHVSAGTSLSRKNISESTTGRGT
jgi:hypothetical protein